MGGESSTRSAARDRFLRWQDRTQQQLGFVNNVVIGLASGTVVFSEGLRVYPRTWERFADATGLALLLASLAAGLALAVNRLRSLRITATINRLGMYLADQVDASPSSTDHAQDQQDEADSSTGLQAHLGRLARWVRFPAVKEQSSTKESARIALATAKRLNPAPDDRPDAPADVPPTRTDLVGQVTTVRQRARSWSNETDRWTYWLLSMQLLMFGVGAGALAVLRLAKP